ncbi:hypothetical protein [Rhizobium ruizarguesonis]|uniref:hypothetical protein n=1 Tax=Rhizobium ruizarguesonis TaxID=2081791 RepID=UPI00103045BE|nr:hypothetical protein [Rhizobium ruizarguesonis]TAW18455.1 hypothetical protein ELI25_22980 [Rhizobium ruizarguesonis]TAZ54036.1 hypothetical protein ELH76_24200 [Rhizobium ruizarguesonis]
MSILDKTKAASRKAVAARNELQLWVEELRSEIFRLREQRREVENAPIGREETVTRIRAELDRLERDALKRLMPGRFRLPLRSGHVVPNLDDLFNITSSPTFSAFEGVGAACVLGNRAEVEAKIVAHAMADMPGEGMSDSERAAQLRKIDAEIDAAERAEEALIRDAEEAGITVFRRRDARPEIFLLRQV